jgi:prepilin-type N-terminal cleavage/methylation domain-containing protein/prepilin-type processing-associated H-X9-DG protein
VNENWSLRTCRRRGGFTLIELLVVVAIIALLISILLPSLNAARKQAHATVCASNLASVGQAFHIYLNNNNAVFPPSYVYPNDEQGNYDLMDQPGGHPFGYVHWSWFLFNSGAVKEELFQCPEMFRGGAPRTNPGPKDADWEPGQVDQNGQKSAAHPTLTDHQARRMAFTCNAAIVPRNKFTAETFEGGDGANKRKNQCVVEGRIKEPRGVILTTEFSDDYTNLSVNADGSGFLVKSHRPINPFYNIGCAQSGTDEYSADPTQPSGFFYPDEEQFPGSWPKPLREIVGKPVIDGQLGSELNAVGRHHPGGDAAGGGTTNFLFIDGHVERKTLSSTLLGRQWGNYYYSLDDEGDNSVRFYHTGS